MPITIQPATLKVKKQNGQYQSADCLKGDKGDPGSVGIIAPDYADLTFPVAQGQPCIHEGLYYIANSAIQSSESWTAAHWTQLTVGEQVTNVLNDIQGKYTKPSGGIPASDIADGVIPVVDSALSDSSENTIQNKVVKGALDTKAPAIINAATGNPAVFNDGVGMPIKSLLIPFTPIQQGTGDPSPENIRSILPWDGLKVFGGNSNILQNVNFKPNLYNVASDGTVTAVNPSSQQYAWSYENSIFKTYLPAGKYTTIEETVIEPTQIGTGFSIKDENNGWLAERGYATFTLAQGKNVGLVCKPGDGAFRYSIVKGTAGEYEKQETTETDIVFPSPVYGGTLDVVSGVLTVGFAVISKKWGEFDYLATTSGYDCRKLQLTEDVLHAENGGGNPGNHFCNCMIYSYAGVSVDKPHYFINTEKLITAYLPEGTSLDTDVVILAKLATPTEQTLTGHQITALIGDNTIWSDADGQMIVEYPADTELFIVNQHRNFIAPELSSMIADTALVKNDFRIVGDNLYKITTAIASGGALTPNTNCVKTTLAEVIKPLLT